MIGPVEIQLPAPVKPSSSVACVYLKGQGLWRMGQKEGLDHIQLVPSLAVCQGVLGLQLYGVGWWGFNSMLVSWGQPRSE